LYRQVKGILEASALDFEKMVAPKEYWFNSDLLDEWFESRRERGAGLPNGEA
jgi:hypothetical protein